MLFQLFGASANRGDVGITAIWARPGYTFGQAAVVATQGAVNFVKHPKRAAVFALAFPAAVGTVQHRGITATVQQQHALFAAFNPFLQSGQQGGREHGAAGLLAHVHPAHFGQHPSPFARANA